MQAMWPEVQVPLHKSKVCSVTSLFSQFPLDLGHKLSPIIIKSIFGNMVR